MREKNPAGSGLSTRKHFLLLTQGGKLVLLHHSVLKWDGDFTGSAMSTRTGLPSPLLPRPCGWLVLPADSLSRCPDSCACSRPQVQTMIVRVEEEFSTSCPFVRMRDVFSQKPPPGPWVSLHRIDRLPTPLSCLLLVPILNGHAEGWQRCSGTITLMCCSREYKTVQPLWKTT